MSLTRVTVQDAAKILSVTEHAIRQRVYRGTLTSEKDEDGRVFVLLDQDAHESPDESPARDSHEIIEMLNDQVSFLRAQLVSRDQELAEMRRLLAGALERIPELEAPQEPRESPTEASTDHGKGDDSPGPERASWWRRFFGV